MALIPEDTVLQTKSVPLGKTFVVIFFTEIIEGFDKSLFVIRFSQITIGLSDSVWRRVDDAYIAGEIYTL